MPITQGKRSIIVTNFISSFVYCSFVFFLLECILAKHNYAIEIAPLAPIISTELLSTTSTEIAKLH